MACSWDHVFYTGNLSYLEAHYGALRAVLDVFYHGRHRARGDDGATPLLLLARPAGYGDFAFVARHGVVAYDNALVSPVQCSLLLLSARVPSAASPLRFSFGILAPKGASKPAPRIPKSGGNR